jgi:hypothetical protein
VAVSALLAPVADEPLGVPPPSIGAPAAVQLGSNLLFDAEALLDRGDTLERMIDLLV